MIIPIDQVEPGMKLARNIISDSGDVLLIKGTELTPQHIVALNRRGFDAVNVVDPISESGGACSGPSSAVLLAAETHVRRRWQQVPAGSPGLSLLWERAVRRAAAHSLT